jgi:hypothetical protein
MAIAIGAFLYFGIIYPVYRLIKTGHYILAIIWPFYVLLCLMILGTIRTF